MDTIQIKDKQFTISIKQEDILKEVARVASSDRTSPSKKYLKSRNNELELNPSMRYYILMHLISYGDTFPYIINYTNW